MRLPIVVLLTSTGCDLVFELADPPVCPRAGCVLAADQGGADDLVVVGDELFWTVGQTNGDIRTCLLSSCEPVSLSPGEDSPHSLLIEGERILFATGDEIRNTTRAGGGSMLTHDNSSVSTIRSFSVAAARIYYTTENMSRCDYDSADGSCVDGSTIDGEFTMMRGPVERDPDGRLWSADGNRLFQIDAADISVIKGFAANLPRAIALSTTEVFIIGDGPVVSGWPLAAANDSPPSRTIAVGMPTAIATDDTHLYIADASGKVVRVELGGDDAPELVAELQTPVSIALAKDRVIVVSAGQIVSIPKP